MGTNAEASRGSASLDIPTFPSLVIEPDVGRPVHVVAWCPWCEDVHWHGAAGGGGKRAPHCAADPHSPLGATGYALDIDGAAVEGDEVRPAGLMVGERRLHWVTDDAAAALRAVVLRAILDVNTARGTVVQRRTPRGNAWIFGAERWLIEPRGRRPIEGSGFLRLAAALYGVPAGVAAVRFLEAACLDRLDAQAALAVQAAIDAWVARGAPARTAR